MSNPQISTINTFQAKPFIRYVGGKRWFASKHSNLFPSEINNYFEPFLGSGSLFFYLKHNKKIKKTSYLNDINNELITTYIQVQKNVEEVYFNLSKLKNTKDDYYKIRNLKTSSNLDLATRYLYLNRTCFGGIYRVNKNGDFNVPYGNREYKQLVDYNNLQSCKTLLNDNVELSCSTFLEVNYEIEPEDFFCLDPPYLCDETKFRRYNKDTFSSFETNALISLLEKICFSNARFLLFIGNNNEFAEKITNLNLGQKRVLTRRNNLSSSTLKKDKVEIIIKNY